MIWIEDKNARSNEHHQGSRYLKLINKWCVKVMEGSTSPPLCLPKTPWIYSLWCFRRVLRQFVRGMSTGTLMRAAAIDFYMWTGAVIKIADVQTHPPPPPLWAVPKHRRVGKAHYPFLCYILTDWIKAWHQRMLDLTLRSRRPILNVYSNAGFLKNNA